MHDFITSCSRHLENTDSISCEYLPNDTFHYIIFIKITFVNITTDLIIKAFMYQEAVKLTACIQVFYNSDFSLKTGLLSSAAITVNCLP